MSRTARQPHLGCTLSLISKANIRYEGILKGIDTDKCTLTLNNVQSYGTENRATKVIPPTAGTYELIIFNGHDIQDVQVVEKEEAVVDPAILDCQKHVDDSPSTSNRNRNKQSSGGRNSNRAYESQLGHESGKSAFSKPSPTKDGKRYDGRRNANHASDNNTAKFNYNQNASRNQANGHARHSNNHQQPQNNQTRSTGREVTENKSKTRASKKERDAKKKASAEDSSSPVETPKMTEKEKKERAEAEENKRIAAREAAKAKREEAEKKRLEEIEALKKTDFDWTTGNKEFDKDKVAEELEKLALKKKAKYEKRKKSKESDTKKEEDPQKSSDEKNSDVEQPEATPSTDKDDKDSDPTSEPAENVKKVYYDKSKSIFDSISCEAMEARNKKRRPMMSRHKERKLNSETFGIPEYSTRGSRNRNHFRGGYRGRGGRGGFNQNRGTYRGGFRGGYRGGYNNRSSFKQRPWVNYSFDVNKARGQAVAQAT